VLLLKLEKRSISKIDGQCLNRQYQNIKAVDQGKEPLVMKPIINIRFLKVGDNLGHPREAKNHDQHDITWQDDLNREEANYAYAICEHSENIAILSWHFISNDSLSQIL